jgi:hypothetical protein
MATRKGTSVFGYRRGDAKKELPFSTTVVATRKGNFRFRLLPWRREKEFPFSATAAATRKATSGGKIH